MKKGILRFSVFLVALGLGVSLAGCASNGGGGAGASPTTLRIYNWGEYISDGSDGSCDLIAEFEKANPDIKVDYKTFATNEEMYAKIVSGSANYDVLIPSDYMIGKMAGEGMLAKLDFDNIPNYKYIDDQFKTLPYDPNNEYSVPYTWGTVGIVYNKTMVQEPVDSWSILWDKKYAGQVLMFNNPRDAYGIAEKKLGFSQNTTDRGQLDQCTELLKQQKPIVQAYVMDQIFQKMPNGEAALAPYYAGDFYTMAEDNPDLAFAIPKEGTNLFTDAMVVLASSNNKEAAERWINFMCEPDVAAANISFLGYSSPSTAVRDLLPEDVRNDPVRYPSKEILAKCEVFNTLDDATTAYMQDGWTDVLAAS